MKPAVYQAIAVTEKKFFFYSVVPILKILNAHFVGAGDQMFFEIDVSIVKSIIIKMLLNPDVNDETIQRALKMFMSIHGAARNENNMTHYCVNIKNRKSFKLVIE